MAWPTPQEYNEAIQNPRTAFADAELRTGQPVLTPLGLPRPITGGFASVYQLVCPNQRTYAVRCFLREYRDHQERYAAISSHLAMLRLPYTVNFTFLDRGIRVNEQWYPILKMEWVEGESLQTHIERNLQNAGVLLRLAEQWVQMAKILRQGYVGHGDLQHGNILVVGGQLRLIDYDGMFVPALAGLTSHEVGHRNYQHPQRSETDFGLEIDHFSTWVVYTSLVALSVDPRLWQAHQGGDECLLFRREDFEHPERSHLFQALESSPDTRVRGLVSVFKSLLALPPDQVPPIDGPLMSTLPATPRLTGWIRDYVQPAAGQPATLPSSSVATSAPAQSPATVAATTAQASPTADPAWILDFLGGTGVTPAAARFGNSLSQGRAAVALSLAVVALTWLAAGAIGVGVAIPALLTVVAATANLGFLASHYAHDPHVLAQRSVRSEFGKLQRQVRTLEAGLERLTRDLNAIERVYQRQVARLEGEERRRQAAEQAVLAKHEQRLLHKLTELKDRERQLRQREDEDARRLELTIVAGLADLDHQIRDLQQAEVAAIKRALAQRQEQFVATYLARQTVEAALIPGIGPVVKQRLKQHGIVRAADVESTRLAQVEGIGDGRATVLLDWRRRVEALARQASPQSLSKFEEVFLRGRYLQRRLKLEREKARRQQKQAGQLADLHRRYGERRQTLSEQETEIHAEQKQRVDTVRQRYRAKRARLQAERSDLGKQAAAQRLLVEQAGTSLRLDLAQLAWRRTALEQQLRNYAGLDFSAYLKRVIGITPP